MSEQIHVITVAPPQYEQVRETMVFHNYVCPVCGGRGEFVDQVGKDEYKRTECDYCRGTGKVKAEVQINWKPDA